MIPLLLLIIGAAVNGEQYSGKHIGKLNSYHHQVSGDVFAVDAYTLLIVGFNYDGNGVDTFFWAGSSNRPGPQGFIIPDEYGKTNVLGRYFNKDFTLTLPGDKKISEINWFAVYDLSSQNTFGDVYMEEDFEAPKPQKIGSLSKRSHAVSSDPVQILDAKTLLIPKLTYNGAGKDTYFWVGVGPQPSSKGIKVPDEYGYVEAIRGYNSETIQLELPGELTVFDIDWFSIYDLNTNENFGSLLIPDEPNVPPSLLNIIEHTSSLPNCIQLHKNLKMSWEVFGPAITIQLSGNIGKDEYMAFGQSPSGDKLSMIGSDVAIAFYDGYRGLAMDYNISAYSPCVKVLGRYKGVCKDDLVGGIDDIQLHTSSRDKGITTITFRRSLISADAGDIEWRLDGPSHLIWAIGQLDQEMNPAFHTYYPRRLTSIDLSKSLDTCFAFTSATNSPVREVWTRPKIIDKTLRILTATLGPAGGLRGYQGITGMASPGLAWYMNGLLIPEIMMKRGFTYEIRVHGGNDPHSAELYNPMIITDEPVGGLERRTEEAIKRIRVLAGVQYTLRGQPRPTAAGSLCIARHTGVDRRLDDDFPTFRKFNRSLTLTCEPGEPAILEMTPNSSWPDIVYYNSYTHSNMGWKIHIVDSFAIPYTDASSHLAPTVLTLILVSIINYLFF